MLGGYLLSRWQAKRAGIKGTHIDNATLLIALLGLFGARVFSWLFYFPAGTSFWQALRDPAGGMVFYGGVIFGFISLAIYSRLRRLSLADLLDVFAPGLALGLAFGRVGCFLAGCCWGDLCVPSATLSNAGLDVHRWQIQTLPLLSRPAFPLAVQFPPGAGAYEQHQELGLIPVDSARSLPVHPVQLYEATLALLLCILLCKRFRKRLWHGQVFCTVILSYGLIRFWMEFLRADNSPIYFGFTLSQVISVAMISAAVAVFCWRRISSPARQQPVLARPGSVA
jgi:phosphatidylglycerol---prolipoprotein diacylglyceryl transferase